MTQLDMILATVAVLGAAVAVLCLVPDHDRIHDQRLAAELSARWRANDPAVRRWAARPLLVRLLSPWP